MIYHTQTFRDVDVIEVEQQEDGDLVVRFKTEDDRQIVSSILVRPARFRRFNTRNQSLVAEYVEVPA